MAKETVLILHNIRSTYNVGSIFRTADGLGAAKLFLTGYTPYPQMPSDGRLPHIAAKLEDQIHKTALGAEKTVLWEYQTEPLELIKSLKAEGYTIAGLEQSDESLDISRYINPQKLALVLGEEVEGIERRILDSCDVILEIPMKGHKESFNVAVAAAIALYQFTFR